MASTQILFFCANEPGSGGNRLTPTAYAGLTTLLADGFVSGIAQSIQVNTVLAQTSFVCAGLANWMVAQGISVPDDGNLANFVTELTAALTAFVAGNTNIGFSTGDMKLTMKSAADSGWLMMNDGTIGSAASSATHANADAQSLYTLLWNNVSNTYAPVTGGRGGSAAADWAANKPLALNAVLGRALAINGAGSGLSVRSLGQTVGEETHQLSLAEIPSHTHTYVPYSGSGMSGPPGGGSSAASAATGSAGSDGAHNNMQPTTFMNIMIKL